MNCYFSLFFVIDPRDSWSTIPPWYRILYYSASQTQTDTRLKSVFVLFFSSISISLAHIYTSTILFTSGPGCFVKYYVYFSCFGISLFMNRFRSRWPAWTGYAYRWEITGPFINDDVRTCVDFSILIRGNNIIYLINYNIICIVSSPSSP